MTPRSLSFWVPGIPAPGGSKKAFIPKGWSRAIITDDSKRNKEWRSVVALAGYEAMRASPDGQILFEGPLSLSITFIMPRIKAHFDSKGNLRRHAPTYVITRPDAGKLKRSTEDALTGVVWHDDAQVSVIMILRIYGGKTGAQIKVEALEPHPAVPFMPSRERRLELFP
jgi:Holliday junction resolvase RusA-like endonuclease